MKRCTGYCENCNSNVLHVRAFKSRLTYFVDRITLSVLGRFGIGPWQCVDCGESSMRIQKEEFAMRSISENEDVVDTAVPIGNFIRTRHSLAHNAADADRFSEKFRLGIVEKLLECKSTVSRTCQELGVSEIEIQRWMKEYMQTQLDKVAQSSGGGLIPAEYAGVATPEPLNWDDSDYSGPVIDSNAVRKPR